jgi:hypothetical protein
VFSELPVTLQTKTEERYISTYHDKHPAIRKTNRTRKTGGNQLEIMLGVSSTLIYPSKEVDEWLPEFVEMFASFGVFKTGA